MDYAIPLGAYSGWWVKMTAHYNGAGMLIPAL